VVADTTSPTASTVNYSPSTLTNTDVIVTVTGFSEPVTITNNGGSNIFTFIADGTFVLEFQDASGNT